MGLMPDLSNVEEIANNFKYDKSTWEANCVAIAAKKNGSGKKDIHMSRLLHETT